MPGFEMHRFVRVKESDLDEFMCGICHEVFNRPKSSLCCGQTYCTDCINSWVSQKSVCPMDRKPLLFRDLIQPPKALMNLLNKLEIRCEFHSRGCQKEVQLSELSAHLKVCEFNPANFCETCGLANDTTHDCISILKLNIESIKDEVKRLKNDNSFLKNILEINYDVNNKAVLVLKSQFSKDMEEKAIRISTEALNKSKGSRVEMAKCIAQEMDQEFGVGWNCFVNHGSNWGSLVKAYKQNYFQFKLGSNDIVIYKTSNYSWNLKLIIILGIFIAFYYRYFN